MKAEEYALEKTNMVQSVQKFSFIEPPTEVSVEVEDEFHESRERFHERPEYLSKKENP